jgi:hypothetical protein
MRFDPLFCPECGEMARGMVETITGVAEFEVDPDGSIDWAGHTRIDWDAQEPLVDDGGNARLVCPGGHEWSARMHEPDKGGDP